MSDRTLKLAVGVLLAALLVSIVVGLILTRSPRLDPVPVPSVSQI